MTVPQKKSVVVPEPKRTHLPRFTREQALEEDPTLAWTRDDVLGHQPRTDAIAVSDRSYEGRAG